MSIQSIRLWIVCVVITMGCMSAPTMSNLNYPLPLIEKAIQNALFKVHSVSQNRREFISHYLTKDGRIWDPVRNDPQRAIVKITILGDRRPYDLEIEAKIEERLDRRAGYSAGFVEIGESQSLAQEISFRIQNYLRMNSKRNLIDDFRVF